MELVDYYITLLREETENQVSRNSSGDVVQGISDELILSWINRGIGILSRELFKASGYALLTQKTYNLSGSSLSIDARAVGGGSIVKVEYLQSGYWKKLRLLEPHKTDGSVLSGSSPCFYDIKGRNIHIWPNVTTGSVRVTYHRLYDQIDKRRGVIESITKDITESYIQSILLSDDGVLSPTALGARSACSIVSASGDIVGSELYYSSYSSRSLTLSPAWEIGDSIIVPGQYVTCGPFSTSHILLPEEERDCVFQFAKAKILIKDGDPSGATEFDLFGEMLRSLVETYQETVEYPEFLDEDTIWESII